MEFLKGADATELGLVLSVILNIIVVVYVVAEKIKVNQVWNNIWSPLIDNLNSEGPEIIAKMIKIAMISVNGETGNKIGQIEKTFKDIKDRSDFYKNIDELIFQIREADEQGNLNGLYVTIKSAVDSICKLANECQCSEKRTQDRLFVVYKLSERIEKQWNKALTALNQKYINLGLDSEEGYTAKQEEGFAQLSN